MATANFYLKTPEAKEDTLVYLYFRYQSNLFKYSTSLKVHPDSWDENKQRFKKSAPGYTEKNGYLNDLEELVESIYIKKVKAKEEINNDTLREALNDEYKTSRNTRPRTFFDYLEEFKETSKGKKRPRTVAKYGGLINHLKEFQNEHHTKLSFSKIDPSFYDRFIEYLQTEKKLLNNTAGKYIKVLKTFLNWATLHGYNTSTHFKSFKAASNDADIIYLTEEELMTLYKMPLANATHKAVRDAFCFACFTGLRFSDLAAMTKDNIKGDLLTLNTQKTRERLIIPLNHYAKEILQRNDYTLRVLSNQKTNEYLKELGKAAGFKDPVMITKYRGGEHLTTAKPKYDYITSHTARRTFVTLSLEKGMRYETVMSITGHKDFKTLKKYIKLTDKVKTIEMQRIWDIGVLKSKVVAL